LGNKIHNSDSPYKYSEACEADIKSMLGFLVNNIYVVSSNNPLAFLWALIVLLYWQTYSYIHMKQNLFRNCYWKTPKKLAVSFNHTFRYIDDVLSINNHNFHNYVHLIYPDELEIKDTTESDKSASYLDILMNIDFNGRLTTSQT
jgi:hypothetical protein